MQVSLKAGVRMASFVYGLLWKLSKLPYLGMRSSYAKARRRKNCRPNVIIRVFALVPHQDASHSVEAQD